MAKIIKEASPRFTVLTHILLLGGISEIDTLKKVRSLVNNSYEIEMAYDLMGIDVKDKIITYSLDYSDEK